MDKVISPDRTLIAYHRNGTGPPLILIPGSGAANPIAWTGVLHSLEDQQHIAMYTVSELFLKNALAFLV